MACRRCGQCCSHATFIMGGIRPEDPGLAGFVSYIRAHHCDVMWVKMGDEPDVLACKVPLICQHLTFNPKTGLSACAIYEDRPPICRNFLCEAARREDEAE